MARTITLLQLRTRVRQLTDTENDTHVSDAELNSILNNAISETYDLLIQHAPPDYFRKTVTFSTTPGTVSYQLATIIPAGDFYKLRKIYVSDGDATGPWRTLDPVQDEELVTTEAVRTTSLIRMDYIPFSPTLSLDADTFDGINGWEEHAIASACADVKAKREEDISPYLRRKDQLAARIAKMAPRDAGNPQRVSRKKRRDVDIYYFHTAQAHSYKLVAGAIEIYQSRFPYDV